MTIGMMLSNLIIGPLKLLFETIYALASQRLDGGMSIVALSLAVNILVYPLYKRADMIQKEARDKEASLAPRIKRIKAAFRGDEQYMILQTYYRQNHHSPLHALKGALPLLLQIPFFIAAYQFLSRLDSLQGVAMGPIQDLSRPDQLIRIGGMTLNLLPVLMTVINLLSGMLYTREAPLKEKIQLAGMAFVFLILLYGSSAGLTFYWTLNNLFSLIKNLLQNVLSRKEKPKQAVPKLFQGIPNAALFFLCVLALALLTGLLIPSAVLADSPGSFVEFLSDIHPIWYAINAMLLATGTFVVWGGVYYSLASAPFKKGMETGVWVLIGFFLVNYLFFRNDLGTITETLKFDTTPVITAAQKGVNLIVLTVTATILILLIIRKKNLVRALALTLVLVLGIMSVRNLWVTDQGTQAVYRTRERNYRGQMQIPLSREGKNVIVLMLDRAISSYLPCILYEKPELKDVFSGFVYYPNTLSFGMHTNLGAPPIFGGYEYTPKAMNARDTESLQDKHNESLLLMPTLFSEKGYKISIFDVPYPGDYTEAGDYSLFDKLPNTNARVLVGSEWSQSTQADLENLRMRNFFCYGIMMTAPEILFGTFYQMGGYNQAAKTGSLFAVRDGSDGAGGPGTDPEFMANYLVLKNLPEITRIQDTGDTLLVMANRTSHTPTLLQEPDYIPGDLSGNAEYDAAHADRFQAGPIPLIFKNSTQMRHYHVNMASMLAVGDWIQEMKEQGVYDNTRIILVSDHGGYYLNQIQDGRLAGEDISGFNPLLMIKDFDADGEIRTDTTFMTNADVPFLAMKNLIEEPVNPFTGETISDDEKKSPQYVSASHDFEPEINHGSTFKEALWFEVAPGGETLFDLSRWTSR